MSKPSGIRVLKGPALADLYSDGLMRPAGDLDLVAENESAFWSAARTVRSEHGATASMLTRFRSEDRTDYVLGLEWPSPDPLMESDYEVELSMIAYVGDGAALPLRPRCPDPDPLAQLLALAEEAVQRPHSVKDAIDVMALLPSFTNLDDGHLIATVHDYKVGPELDELLRFSAAAFPESFTDPRARRSMAVVAEIAARERLRRPAPRTEIVDITRWPADISFGVRLPDDGRPDHSAVSDVAAHEFQAGEVLCTPVGDFLMVTGREIDEATWDSAVRQLVDTHPITRVTPR